MKFFISVWAFLIILAAAFGICSRQHMRSIGLYGVTKESQMEDREVGLTYLLSDDDIDAMFPEDKVRMEKAVKDMYFSSDYALIVKAEGDFLLYHRSMNQYAYVEQVIRLKDLSDVTGKDGHPKKGNRVLLHTDGGFDFGYEKDDETGLIPYDQDQIVYFELSSLPMKEGQTYLYFGNESKLNSCRKTPLYYAGDGMIEYFSLDSQNLSYCDKEASAATYQDFALCDYLVRSEKGAKRIEEVKEMLLDMLSVK